MLIGALALGGLAAARWFNVTGTLEDGALSVAQAYDAARNGTLTLVDIRRPDEWALTGVPEGAHPLDMRSAGFSDQLLALVSDKDAPVALICARGVRSRGLARRLAQAGFSNILDVPEGMLGSGAGPGWLAAGLPVRAL